MDIALDTYFEIVPEYSDPDTYVKYTISNGFCRALLQIYADLYALSYVARALVEDALPVLPPESMFDFKITDELCMNIGFAIIPACQPNHRIFRALLVNTDAPHPYRTQIDIVLNQIEAKNFQMISIYG